MRCVSIRTFYFYLIDCSRDEHVPSTILSTRERKTPLMPHHGLLRRDPYAQGSYRMARSPNLLKVIQLVHISSLDPASMSPSPNTMRVKFRMCHKTYGQEEQTLAT